MNLPPATERLQTTREVNYMILAIALAVIGLVVIGIAALVLLGERAYGRALRWQAGIQDLHGILLHPGRFYHPGHTWIMPEGVGTVRVGMDDFGRKLVGDIRNVELPAKGSRLRRGEEAVQLDCGEKRARLLSPVDGVVTTVNEGVAREGSALERDPYGKGWLFTAEVADRGFTSLPTGSAAVDWMKRETGRLAMFLHGELGVTAADGGELVPRPPEMLSDDQWEHLVSAFFHPSEHRGEHSEQ
jgi:glycine cleavage system H lipoate-binding protein